MFLNLVIIVFFFKLFSHAETQVKCSDRLFEDDRIQGKQDHSKQKYELHQKETVCWNKHQPT